MRTPFAMTFILLMLKMVLYRYFIYGDVHYHWLIADAAALMTAMGLFELLVPVKWRPVGYGILNASVSLLLLAAAVYYNYYGTVPIYTAVYHLDQVGQAQESVGSAMRWRYGLLLLDLAVMLVVGVWSVVKGIRIFTSRRFARPLYVGIASIVGAFVSGGYIAAYRDIPNEWARAESLGFLNYEVMAVVQGSHSMGMSGESIQAVASAWQQLEERFADREAADAPVLFGAAKGKNVIVIQLEAFQNFVINLTVDGQAITPNLNSLIGESIYFPRVFQTIGQGNTSDAEFSANTSIYPAGDIAMSTGYGDRVIPSLPRLLKEEGYVSYTFHVNDVTFWDRNLMYPAIGFTKYYDKPFFANDKFNAFGASDEVLYRTGLMELKKLHESGQRFYAQFVTASSHHPFKVPEELKHIRMPDALQGTQLGNYLIALNYTDAAIGSFIQALKDAAMWDDTVLVLYGDHFGLQPQENDPAWVSEQLGIPYEDRVSRFNIPLIIRVPGERGAIQEQAGGQIDIMPTLANLLGISLKQREWITFGHDLMNAERNVVGMRYYLPTGSFINDEVMFIPGHSFDDGTAIDLQTLQPVVDFRRYRPDYDYVLSLLHLSDQYVNVLPARYREEGVS